MSCQHETFEARAEINRLHHGGGEEVYQFACDLTVHCVDCGAPFGFRGLPNGIDPNRPTRSVDALTLTAPLLSPSEMELKGGLAGIGEDPPIDGPGFTINVEVNDE